MPVKTTTGRAKRKDVAGSVLFQQIPDWTTVDVSDGIAVHDAQFHTVHYLNHTAAAIFLLCKQPISREILGTIIQEEFKLKSSPAKAIRETIQEMVRTGLLREVEKPDPRKSSRK